MGLHMENSLQAINGKTQFNVRRAQDTLRHWWETTRRLHRLGLGLQVQANGILNEEGTRSGELLVGEDLGNIMISEVEDSRFWTWQNRSSIDSLRKVLVT